VRSIGHYSGVVVLGQAIFGCCFMTDDPLVNTVGEPFKKSSVDLFFLLKTGKLYTVFSRRVPAMKGTSVALQFFLHFLL